MLTKIGKQAAEKRSDHGLVNRGIKNIALLSVRTGQRFNNELKKIDEKSKAGKVGAGIGFELLGADQIHKALTSGDLTGRSRYYLGADPQTKSYLQHGFSPYWPDDHSRGLYAHKNKAAAGDYGVKTFWDKIKKSPDDLADTRNKPFELRLPLWKKLRGVTPEQFDSGLGVHFKEGVPEEYIKGSSKYLKYTPQEFFEYVKVRPKAFAKGLGRAGVGAGLLGGGAYLLGRTFNNSDRK